MSTSACTSSTIVTTAVDGTTSSTTYVHQCVIEPTRTVANQHQRTEYGACFCGRRFRRVIRWAERRVWQEHES